MIRAEVPTSTRSSPPPTSEPRVIRTTPNSPFLPEAVRHQRPVPLLEDVQRKGGAGKEHGGQREHPEGRGHHRPRVRTWRSAAPVGLARRPAWPAWPDGR